MKRMLAILAAVILVSSVFILPANAEDVAFAGLNLQGDTAYLFTHKAFAAGIGTDIISIKDGLVTIRGEILQTKATGIDKSVTVAGGAAMINLPKLANHFGAAWIAKTINPSVGPFAGYDFKSKKLAVGAIVTIIKIAF